MSFMTPPEFQGAPGQQLSPPPSYVPQKPAVSYIIDCMNEYTYVWLWNGDSFWFYPISVQYGQVTGYRWNGAFWTFYGFDDRLISAVSCPPIPTLY